MSVARTRAIALRGMHGAVVEVEADLTSAVPGLVLIGLPDASLSEARDRVRSAAQNTGCPLPARRITINLSPAALPKHGASFDLAIAVVAAAAAGLFPAERASETVHIGELSLDGRLRPVAGVLPAVREAHRIGAKRIVVPHANAAEAKLIPGAPVEAACSLREVLRGYGAELSELDEPPLPLAARPPRPANEAVDLSDVLGQREAVAALLVAAVGGHHVFFLGPPGAGKTMLASRLPTILPELDLAAALELAAVRSVAGEVFPGALDHQPPWQAPHHTATRAAIAGGGQPLRPGAASLASHGVLFLDEAPEFARGTLDVLRQPLESGQISIDRAHGQAQFPASFQLVLAANPCPCGNWGAEGLPCECPPQLRRRYLARISGPLADRIDVQLWLPPLRSAQRTAALDASEGAPLDSATARSRVNQARERAARRWVDTPWRINAQVSGPWLRKHAPSAEADAAELLEIALRRGSLSMRGADRVLRTAWSCADLAGRNRPNKSDVRQALTLRKGLSQC